MKDVFERRIAEIVKLKEDEFADLYFNCDATDNPLTLDLGGVGIRTLKLSLSTPGIINLGSIRLYETGKKEPINLVDAAKIKLSSQYFKSPAQVERGMKAFLEGHASKASVHTLKDDRPWVTIDLGKEYRLKKLVLNNRNNQWANRSWRLSIEGKGDGRMYHPIYSHKRREVEFAMRVGQKMSETGRWPKMGRAALEALDLIALAILRGDYKDASDELHLQQASMSARNVETIKEVLSQGLLRRQERFWTAHGIIRSFAFWSLDEKVDYIRSSSSILDALRDMTDNACFGYGSALCCERDGDFIPHDDDLDLLVAFHKSEVDNVQDGIQRMEQFLTQRGFIVSGDFKLHRKVKKKGKKAVDVFVGIIDGKKSVSWFPGPAKGIPLRFVFPPKQAELLGEKFLVPARPNKYLALVYGKDWHIPQARWNHKWHAKRNANLE